MLDRGKKRASRHMAAGAKLAVVAGLAIAGATVGIMNPLQAQAAQETRVFTWKNGEAQPNVPQTITVNGEELKLKNTSQPKQSGVSNATSQTFNKSIDMTVGKDQKDAIPSLVPGTTHVSEGGYDGDIARTKIDYTPIYVPQTKTETDDRVQNFTTKDDNNFPATVNKNGHTLQRTGVTWENAHVQSNGTVDLYKGTAHYETSYSYNELDHFNVTAYYQGTLTRGTSSGDWSMTATYESEPAASSSQPNSGVTATFEDLDSFDGNATDNSNSANTNNENANDTNANDNENSNENSNSDDEDVYTGSTKKGKDSDADSSDTSTKPDSKANGVPVVPIAAGIGAIAVIGIAAAIVKKRKKKGGKSATAADPAQDQFTCELIEYYDDGYTDDNQRKIATMQGVLSNEADAPTIVWCPDASQIPEDMWEDKAANGPWEIVDDGDGEHIEFAPDSKFDYYLVLSKIADAVSDRLLVVAANEAVIYDGEIAENVKLDPDALADGVNGNTSDPDIRYLGDLLEDEGLHVPGDDEDDTGDDSNDGYDDGSGDDFADLDDPSSTGGFDAIDDDSGFGGVTYDDDIDDLDSSSSFEPLTGFDDEQEDQEPDPNHDSSLDDDFSSVDEAHDDSLDDYFDSDEHDDSLDHEDQAPHPDDVDDGFSFDVD